MKEESVLQIQSELLALLEMERDTRKTRPDDTIVLNRFVAIGNRAGVANARPHRFRDTLAVDMLSRGATPDDVAKVLGDTIETIEKHYTPFVKKCASESARSSNQTAVMEVLCHTCVTGFYRGAQVSRSHAGIAPESAEATP